MTGWLQQVCSTVAGKAFVVCGPNFKQLGRLVAETSVETWFPIVTACWGPTVGFRCKPAVRNNQAGGRGWGGVGRVEDKRIYFGIL